MANCLDVIIVGGGLGGLTAALHLQKFGLNVTLIEKNEFPQHKVCGEYISNEVLPYLHWLDIDLTTLMPTSITKLQLTTVSGKSIFTDLPLGGFGISRYELDNYLYKQLLIRGVNVIIDAVNDISFEQDLFSINTLHGSKLTSKWIIGAYGKRSSIDIKLNRAFIKKQANYLAVKGHFKGNFPEGLVALHNFNGGYCGISKVEDQKINICYLANINSFKNYKNIELYQKEVLYQNKALKKIFEETEPLFEDRLTISQVSFERKSKVENHILMIGDTAGLIHPLCGNGMAMAIHSAKIASELIIAYFEGQIATRSELETSYQKQWEQNFNARLKFGSYIATILKNHKTANILLAGLTKVPFILNQIIKKTHGDKISNLL